MQDDFEGSRAAASGSDSGGGEGGVDRETKQIWEAVTRMANLTLLGAGATAAAAGGSGGDAGESGQVFDEEAAFRVAL